MPFTVSHIAAVLPIARWWRGLSFPALAIGSMLPDMPVFLPVGVSYVLTHRWVGLLTVCLPLGLICLAVYDLLLRKPMVALLPSIARDRLAGVERGGLKLEPMALFTSSLALAIGSATHIAWDAFTHAGRWGVELFPVLYSRISLGGRTLVWYQVLQYGCSLLGLLAVLAYGAYRIRQTPSREDPAGIQLTRLELIWGRCLLVGLPVTLFCSRLLAADTERLKSLLVEAILDGCVSFLITAIGFATFVRLRRWRPASSD